MYPACFLFQQDFSTIKPIMTPHAEIKEAEQFDVCPKWDHSPSWTQHEQAAQKHTGIQTRSGWAFILND